MSFPSVVVTNGIHELQEDLSGSAFRSPDMAPITRAGRKWGLKDIAALWIEVYHYAWFISFAVSVAVYVGLTKAFRPT